MISSMVTIPENPPYSSIRIAMCCFVVFSSANKESIFFVSGTKYGFRIISRKSTFSNPASLASVSYTHLVAEVSRQITQHRRLPALWRGYYQRVADNHPPIISSRRTSTEKIRRGRTLFVPATGSRRANTEKIRGHRALFVPATGRNPCKMCIRDRVLTP